MTSEQNNGNLSKKLQAETAAVRIQKTKFGESKALLNGQQKRVADEFKADAKFVKSNKKLINVKNEAYRNAMNVLNAATITWQMISIPYPEKGIRLIQRSLLESFNAKMQGYQTELSAAAEKLQAEYSKIRDEAKLMLGELYNQSDYPTNIADTFSLAWDFPNVNPPDYLKQLNPKLYEQQQSLVAARFSEAIALTEQALAKELQDMIVHLADKLNNAEDGKPKIFRDSAVENINEFFKRVTDLGISGTALDPVIEQAQAVMKGIDVNKVRHDNTIKSSLKESLAAVATSLEGLVVTKPSRGFAVIDE